MPGQDEILEGGEGIKVPVGEDANTAKDLQKIVALLGRMSFHTTFPTGVNDFNAITESISSSKGGMILRIGFHTTFHRAGRRILINYLESTNYFWPHYLKPQTASTVLLYLKDEEKQSWGNKSVTATAE